MKKLSIAIISICTLLTAGCASQLLSEDRLLTNTAGALGIPVTDLTISNRSEQVPNTYYTAKTKSGVEYACIINGGGILAAGMINPPQCTKKGEVAKPYNPFVKK
jgi:hypothetical protein